MHRREHRRLIPGHPGEGLSGSVFRLFACLVMLIVGSVSVHAGEDRPVQAASKAEMPFDEEQNAFLKFIYGQTPRNGIVFLPFGMHTKNKERKITRNNLIGVVYDSISAGTFINSFHDRTWYLVLMRNIYASHGFGLDYFVGALYGYRGKLATVKGIPFRHSFLIKHNLNPVISVDGWYRVSDHLQLQVMMTPLVVLAGAKYNF